MPIICLGLSHHTAPVDVRERHAFPPSRMDEALAALHDYPFVQEAAMLQTCGRLEIYAEIEDYESGVAQLKTFLTNYRHGAVAYDLESYLYTLLGREAIEHLLRVSTGLDSMLIGEAEILGQVKDAHMAAHRAGTLGTTLHRLFREAMSAGKAARSRTRIGEESASIATAALDLARRNVGTLEKRCIAIIGAGKMGRAAVRRIRQTHARDLVVVNRSIEHARELIAEAGFGRALELTELNRALEVADVVVTSTGGTEFLLDLTNVRAAMANRPEQPLFIVDIAVPRDVDPEVAGVPGVRLVDVDGLRSVIDEKLDMRREAIPAVEAIILEYLERFERWYGSRLAIPSVASLTQKAEAMREAEVERLFARCPDLTERERTLVIGMSMTIVSRLLHSAVTKIRDKALSNDAEAMSHARMLDELFELDISHALTGLIRGQPGDQ